MRMAILTRKRQTRCSQRSLSRQKRLLFRVYGAGRRKGSHLLKRWFGYHWFHRVKGMSCQHVRELDRCFSCLVADPRIIDNPQPIKVVTYRELRELSYMGASVLHEDAVFPVRKAGIPINIRNTNDPKHLVLSSSRAHAKSLIIPSQVSPERRALLR